MDLFTQPVWETAYIRADRAGWVVAIDRFFVDLVRHVELSKRRMLILLEVVSDICCFVFCDAFLVGLKPVLDLVVDIPGQCPPGDFFGESVEGQCVGWVGKGIIDVLVVCDCAWSETFIGVREEKVWVCFEVLEGHMLVW